MEQQLLNHKPITTKHGVFTRLNTHRLATIDHQAKTHLMNLKESILQILSDKKAKRDGLHVKHIARHIHNINNNLFSDLNEIDFDNLKKKVNRILATDVKKKEKMYL
jgi:hypothetical protein